VLSARSRWKGVALVLHCWVVIGAAMALGIAWPAPFPVSRASLRRKIMRDLTGQTFVKQRFGPLAEQLRARQRGESV
jgi:hypothetical protein